MHDNPTAPSRKPDHPQSETIVPPTFNFSPTLQFLEELSQNNQKTWFDANRPAYQSARGTFEDFINHLIDELRSSDELLGLSAKECIARIHRDIRFSNDKSGTVQNRSKSGHSTFTNYGMDSWRVQTK